MTKPPVLLIAEYGVLNGGEHSLLAVLPSLQQQGWEFASAVPTGSPLEFSLRQLGIVNHGLSLHQSQGQRRSQDSIRDQLDGLLERVAPQLVHANSLSTARLVGPVTQRRAIPALGYLRDILKLSRTAVGDLNRLDRLVAVSTATARWHVGQGMAPERVEVIHNGIDVAQWSGGIDSGSSGGENSQRPVLLYVGQLGMRKGVEVALQAFLEVLIKYPTAEFWLVGERHSRKDEAIEYERRLHHLGAQAGRLASSGPRVQFLGRRDDVAHLMRQATLLVHPARQEPLGRVLLEAAAAGLPIVTSDVGGSAEILSGPLSRGGLVPPDRPEILAATVVRWLSDPNLQRQAAVELQALVRAQFSVERCASRLSRVYRRLLAL